MKIKESISTALISPILLLILALILFLGLTPKPSFSGPLLIVLWVFVISGGLLLLQTFIKWQKNRKMKPFITFPAIGLVILAVWFISIRISSGIWGPVLAWDSKWVTLLLLALYFGVNLKFLQRIRTFREQFNQMENTLIQKDIELEFMRNQFDPHFLFNSLNNVAAIIMVNRDLALKYTYKLAEMLRYQVGISSRETVGILEEDTFIRNYLDVERLRLGERFPIEYISEIMPGDILLPPYLLHPLIEQSLHQSQGFKGNSFVSIKLIADIKKIRLNINFAPTNNPRNSKSSATGFQLVSKRLNLLFPGRHSLSEIKKNNTREIELEIVLS